MSQENLQRVFDQATKVDLETARQAWRKYHDLTTRIAQRHGYTSRTGAAIFAALSPNNDYYGNLRDVHRLLGAAARDRINELPNRLDLFKVSTYGSNKRKAWRIAKGADPLEEIVAPKTRNFFLNVADPDDPNPVTVDGHIYNAWKGERMKLNSYQMIVTKRRYHQVADDIRAIAQEVRMAANTVQGIIWYSWRRMHNIKTTDQLEFWDPEVIAARLGFEMVAPAGIAPATQAL